VISAADATVSSARKPFISSPSRTSISFGTMRSQAANRAEYVILKGRAIEISRINPFMH
jgi:hypothetical protein